MAAVPCFTTKVGGILKVQKDQSGKLFGELVNQTRFPIHNRNDDAADDDDDDNNDDGGGHCPLVL